MARSIFSRPLDHCLVLGRVLALASAVGLTASPAVATTQEAEAAVPGAAVVAPLPVGALESLLSDGEAPQTLAHFEETRGWLEDLDEPRFAGVAEPVARMGIESLTSYLDLLKSTAAAEVGAHLGVTQGFNALDGD